MMGAIITRGLGTFSEVWRLVTHGFGIGGGISASTDHRTLTVTARDRTYTAPARDRTYTVPTG